MVPVAVALWASFVGFSGATTAPGQSSSIHVRLSDTGVWIQFQGQEARGVIANFEIVNVGKEPHSFSLLGKQTPVLRPGGKASFTVTLLRRGAFPYRSTADKGKVFRGYFIVY
jgi:hypothetical protein